MKEKLILFDIDYTLFDTDTFKASQLRLFSLYPFVEEVLRAISGAYTLGILSQGEKELQEKKLKETGIIHFFDPSHMYIVENKHTELEKIMKSLVKFSTILVEDKKEMLERAHEFDSDLVTVWVKNGPYASSTLSEFKPSYAIPDVASLPELLVSIDLG